MKEALIMNYKERERIKVMARLQEGTLKQKLAAKQLNISVRQIKRLYRDYLLKGDEGLVSKRRGKISNHSLPIELKNQAAELITLHYSDFGPTLAHEKMITANKLFMSVSTVRNIMIEHKIWQSKKPKTENVHKLRERRECLGELVQMDGSYHDWFEGRLPKCCLLVLIDDATSNILWLEFVHWESCWAYFRFFKKYLYTHGRPTELYTDRHAIFETTRKTEKNYKDSQFHRAMVELGIKLILALSPQAKGRVERVNRTLQDRLVKEMRLAGISTMEEANDFLENFISKFNKRFGKKPKNPTNAHRPLDENHNLECILCLRFERRITKDLMVYWEGKRFQITETNCLHRLGGKKVTVLKKEDGSIKLLYQGESLKFINFDEQPEKNEKQRNILAIPKDRKMHKFGSNHPWRRWRPTFSEKSIYA